MPLSRGRAAVGVKGLGALQMLVAVNAIGGGVFGLTGAPGVPREWLAGSPFSSYLIPSLVLIVAVGGLHFLAAVRLWQGHPRALPFGRAAGAILLGWIAAQMAIIGYVSWLQPAMGATGVIELELCRRLALGGVDGGGVCT